MIEIDYTHSIDGREGGVVVHGETCLFKFRAVVGENIGGFTDQPDQIPSGERGFH